MPTTGVALAVATATPRSGPVVAPDEMGYLAGAREIAGIGNSLDMAGEPYYPIGWPTLAALPARMFAGDAEATYIATVSLQVALLALTAIVAMFLARSAIGADPFVAGLSAALAVTVPSAVVTTRFAWSEAFLTTLVSVTALLVLLTLRVATQDAPWERRSLLIVASAGGAVGWMPLSHGRLMLAALCVFVCVVAVLAMARRGKMVACFVGGALATSILGTWLTRYVQSRVWGGAVPSNVDKVRRGLSTPDAVWQTAQIAGGHVWSLLIGSLGLGAIAMWVAVETLARRRATGEPRLLRRLFATPERCFALVCLMTLFATLISDAAFFSGSVYQNGTNRQDHFLYGRYLDIFQPLLITVGLAACLQAARRGDRRRCDVPWRRSRSSRSVSRMHSSLSSATTS